MCARAFVRPCVRVCACARMRVRVCVCVRACMCDVCAWGGGLGGGGGVRACVCVFYVPVQGSHIILTDNQTDDFAQNLACSGWRRRLNKHIRDRYKWRRQ